MNPKTIALALYELESELERELAYRNISFKKYDRLYFFDAEYRKAESVVIQFPPTM